MSAAKPPRSPCLMLFPWQDDVTIGVLQVLGRFCWSPTSCFGEAQLSKQLSPSAHSCAGRLYLYSWTHCSELFPGGWCMLLSTDRAGKEEKEDEPSTENNVKSSKRGAHTALHDIILHLWHFILMTVQPFLLGKDPSGSVWCANHSCPEGNTAGTPPRQMCWACV